eukprot:15430486-Alexandrium_andersonii.AAC.1
MRLTRSTVRAPRAFMVTNAKKLKAGRVDGWVKGVDAQANEEPARQKKCRWAGCTTRERAGQSGWWAKKKPVFLIGRGARSLFKNNPSWGKQGTSEGMGE